MSVAIILLLLLLLLCTVLFSHKKMIPKVVPENKHKNSLKQGRNEVYGIRDQRPEKDRDQLLTVIEEPKLDFFLDVYV